MGDGKDPRLMIAKVPSGNAGSGYTRRVPVPGGGLVSVSDKSVWKRSRCFGPNVSFPPVIDKGKFIHLLQSSLAFFSGDVQLRGKVFYVSSKKFSVCDVSWIPLKRQQ